MRATDEDLVEAFQGGDTAVFDILVQRWDRKIQGAIYRFVGASEDARDLCQEAFLRAYRGLRTFKKDARFSSWLYQIALNVCRDRLRRRRGRTLVSLEELDEHGQEAAVLPGPSPLELAEARYEGGVADYLEVLDAQRSLFQAELEQSEIISQHLVSLVRLYKALAGGWPGEEQADGGTGGQ